jgi:hypothetical protein
MIAIIQRYLGPIAGFKTEEEIDIEEETKNEDRYWWTAKDTVIDIQARHSSHVVRIIYTHGIDEAPKTVAAIEAQFWQASERWYQFLGFPLI